MEANQNKASPFTSIIYPRIGGFAPCLLFCRLNRIVCDDKNGISMSAEWKFVRKRQTHTLHHDNDFENDVPMSLRVVVELFTLLATFFFVSRSLYLFVDVFIYCCLLPDRVAFVRVRRRGVGSHPG